MTTTARLEHINLTVADPDATAALLGELFDWHVRWWSTTSTTWSVVCVLLGSSR